MRLKPRNTHYTFLSALLFALLLQTQPQLVTSDSSPNVAHSHAPIPATYSRKHNPNHSDSCHLPPECLLDSARVATSAEFQNIPAPQTNTTASTILHFLLSVMLSPFRLFTSIVLGILSPLILVLQYTYYTICWILKPWSLLGRLEALYLYCGSAAVIGAFAGLVIGFANAIIFDALGLREVKHNNQYIPNPRRLDRSGTLKNSHTRRDRRPIRARTTGIKDNAGAASGYTGDSVSTTKSQSARPTYPLSVPTILEEEDEDSIVPLARGGRVTKGHYLAEMGIPGPKWRGAMLSDSDSET